jgi:hypothetical protein
MRISEVVATTATFLESCMITSNVCCSDFCIKSTITTWLPGILGKQGLFLTSFYIL